MSNTHADPLNDADTASSQPIVPELNALAGTVLPKDVKDIAHLLHSMQIQFHPSILPLLLDYYHTIAREALVSLHEMNSYADKQVVEAEDAELALALVAQKHQQPITPELLFPIAQHRNSIPIPVQRSHKDIGDIALPPERFRLTTVSWEMEARSSEFNNMDQQQPSTNGIHHGREDMDD